MRASLPSEGNPAERAKPETIRGGCDSLKSCRGEAAHRRTGTSPFEQGKEVKSAAGIVFCLVAIISGLALTSCTTWKPVVLPSGQHGFTVDCSGTNLSWSHCYRKAGRACPHGYDITQKLDAHGSKLVPGDLYGVLGGSVQDRSLLIQCRNDSELARRQPGILVPAASANTGATTYPASGGS